MGNLKSSLRSFTVLFDGIGLETDNCGGADLFKEAGKDLLVEGEGSSGSSNELSPLLVDGVLQPFTSCLKLYETEKSGVKTDC